MEGTHDLGGKQGFGAIPIGDNEGFHHDWERRMWAMARGGASPTDITIDWFRHGIERMVPTDYLSFNYFNKWCTNYLMVLIDSQVITMQEALNGYVDIPGDPALAISLTEVLAANRASNASFATEIDAESRFSVGDTVSTKRLMPANHTRLPAYARNATGTVITHHGAHMLADKGALGLHEGAHLYTVSFAARELWGNQAHPKDTVTLELWESYIV